MLLHGEFEAQVARTPGQVALHCGGRTITCADLNAQADDVAVWLGVRSAGPLVGVSMERSIEYVIAVLGILKSGRAVVPLPPAYPAARLNEIAAFARIDTVLTAGGDRGRAFGDAVTVELGDIGRTDGHQNRQATQLSADSPAFVLSSSGSTGRPKLITRSHRSFFHRLGWTWTVHPFAEGEVCVQKSHASTTHAVYELFEPLLRGTSIHIVQDHDVRRLDWFWNFLREHAVSRLLIVPSMLQAALDLEDFTAIPFNVLVLMGEYVPSALAARLISTFPERTQLYSIYGSTEASSTLLCDIRKSYRTGEELPLGVSITSDIVPAIMDDELRPVEPGDAGMLYVAGPALFSGYLNDPERTAAAFATFEGTRYYRTNDRVRLRSDGDIEFIGRTDDVVKIRGFRVDLNEVERAIAELPGITHYAAVVGGDAGGPGSLVAFVTPATAHAPDVISRLRQKLPAQMIPSVVIALDALPRTASGKVDRLALRSRFADAVPVDENAELSPTEARLHAAWQQVLQHARFTPDTSFFEAGGTSLNVFSLAHRLRKDFSLDHSVMSDLTVYRQPTIRSLAAWLDAHMEGRQGTHEGTDGTMVSLKRGSDPDLPPLFLISSAGGTLGAYSKLVEHLPGDRDVLGVRDPFLWGDRDPTAGFQAWVRRYVDAMISHRDRGPYHIVAYSSAGAFGYEIARKLRERGLEVGLLALIDPLAIDRSTPRRFGYWALEARFRRRSFAWLVRLSGSIRGILPLAKNDSAEDWRLSETDYASFAEAVRRDCNHIRRVAALLELNSGLAFSLDAADVAAAGPENCLSLLLRKAESIAPEMDPEMVSRLVVQYELQVRAQHNYRLRKFDGDVCVIEPAGPYQGLNAAVIRPYAAHMRRWAVPVSSDTRPPDPEVFPVSIRTHYLCMRDDAFATASAGIIASAVSDYDSRRGLISSTG